MSKIQDEMIKAELEETDESDNGQVSSAKQLEQRLDKRRNLSKSTTVMVPE